jgi:RNA polymerase sigma-70 factor (ECF subfamily)
MKIVSDCADGARLAHGLLWHDYDTHAKEDTAVNNDKLDAKASIDSDLALAQTVPTSITSPTQGKPQPTGSQPARHARFDALLAAHLPSLSRVAYRICGHRETAEDVVQETLIRAWKYMDNIRDEKAAKGWLFMILRRECARSFQRQTPLAAEMEIERLTDGKYESAIDTMALYEAIDSLPDKYRLPLIFHAIGGYGVKKIATELELNSATVKTRLFRAREKLRGRLLDESASDVGSWINDAP